MRERERREREIEIGSCKLQRPWLFLNVDAPDIGNLMS
jgi:hypothetical protein